MKTEDGHVVDQRKFDTPGRRESDMELHTSVDRLSNGPKKALYSVIGLLLTAVGLLTGILVQTFRAGEWTGDITAHVEEHERNIDAHNLQLQGIITSLQSMVMVDSVQNFQIRQNAENLEEIKQDLRAHRRVSEQ